MRIFHKFLGNFSKLLNDFSGYIYDGASTLFITSKLPEDVMNFSCETREGKQYRLTLKYTKQTIDRTDPRILLVMNIMLRRAMDGLNLKQLQRNLFDPENFVREKFSIVLNFLF